MTRQIRYLIMMGALLATDPNAWAAAMTPEQAYAAIPHQRPIFDVSAATMPAHEAAYLRQLFGVIDLAVKERVETLVWLQSRHAQGDGVDDYDALLARLSALEPPAKLRLVHRLVSEAIQEHRDVLRQWRRSPAAISMNHPLVRSSSQKLYQAYGRLIKIYATEHPRNLQAFYDYFCSLDFL